MSTEFNYFLRDLSQFYNFILGADPGPYMPNDINYWRRFNDFYDKFKESLEIMGEIFIEELGKRGINVNTLDEAQAEIERIARAQQAVQRQVPPIRELPIRNVAR